MVIVVAGRAYYSNSTKSNNTKEAIKILENIPEIKTIQDSVIKAGRKPFFASESEEGNIVTISLRESFPEDAHTSRVDTFNVNIKTNEITVADVVNNSTISLEEWKKTVKDRF